MNAPAQALEFQSDQPDPQALIQAPSLERRRLQCHLAQVCVDVVVLLLAFSFVSYLYTGGERVVQDLVMGQLVLPIFLTVALYNGTYSIASLADPLAGTGRALVALVLATLLVALLTFLTKTGAEFSRVGFAAGALLAGVMLGWGRLAMRAFVRWRCGHLVRNDLVINDDGPELSIPGAINVSASRLGIRADLDDPDLLDRVGSVLRNIDRVVVSCPPDRRAAWAMLLKGANVEGEVLDEGVIALGAHGARVVGNQGTLVVSVGPLGLRARAFKRLFDIACATGGLVALSPLLVLVAIAIKLEDGGSVFFLQKRVGRGNRFFKMYKFRSMTETAADREGVVSTARNDKRVTRIGAIIRRTSIDELPQLLNVLKGEMSIVGPRPHALGSQAGEKLFWEVDRRYWHRHCLKPGLSGLAQVRGFRGATDSERDLVDRLQSDLEYIEGWTIVRDVKIILLTLRVIVHDRAY